MDRCRTGRQSLPVVICVTFFMFINHMDISALSNPPPGMQGMAKSAAANMLVLEAGQSIEARVAQILAKGVMLLDLSSARLMVKTQESLPAGQKLNLQVESDKGNVRLVILNNTDGKATVKLDVLQAHGGLDRGTASGAGAPVSKNTGMPSQPRSRNLPSQEPPQALRMTRDGQSEPVKNSVRGAAPVDGDSRPVVKTASQALQAEISRAVQKAITNQNSLSGIFAEARQVLQDPKARLPENVQQALKNLLGLRLSGQGKISGPDIRQAFSGSGIFMENRLAGKTAGEFSAGADLKSALVRLNGALKAWLGETAQPHTAPQTRLSPPFKQGMPQGQPPRSPVLETGSALPEAGRILLGEARAALSRLTLLQTASLPSHNDAALQRAAEWNFEIPLKLGEETAIAQFRIDSETKGERSVEQRQWNVQISLDVPQTGPVHAALSLRGEAVRINLWAQHDDTLAMFKSQKAWLKAALEDSGLEAGRISFQKGLPKVKAPEPGSIMDQIQ